MYGKSEIYELDGCVGMIWACVLNEMVSNKRGMILV